MNIQQLIYIAFQKILYVFKDMKIEEFVEYTKKILEQNSPGYINLKRKDAFYQPKLEVVKYFQKNDFKFELLLKENQIFLKVKLFGLYPQ